MMPKRHVAAFCSGVLLLGCLSGCASIPSNQNGRTGSVATGPPVPQALRAQDHHSGFVAAVVPVLKTTGNVLLDIATAVLPEPASKVGLWTHGFDYSDGLTGFDRDGDEGITGCIANTAVQWCPYFLAP
jgi:uncharacterized protein YceK